MEFRGIFDATAGDIPVDLTKFFGRTLKGICYQNETLYIFFTSGDVLRVRSVPAVGLAGLELTIGTVPEKDWETFSSLLVRSNRADRIEEMYKGLSLKGFDPHGGVFDFGLVGLQLDRNGDLHALKRPDVS